MNKMQTLAHAATHRFSKLVLDFLAEHENIKPFVQDFPSIESVEKQIEVRKKYPFQREVLVQELEKNYAALSAKPKVLSNVELLKDNNTFTITTAHQPIIFGGPLYFFYKIIHAIKLADYLKTNLPEYNFVPIYYMGSEDSDMEEIGTFQFRNKQYSWSPPQEGPAGRIPTDSLQAILQEIIALINTNSDNGKKLATILQEAYRPNTTLSEATHYLVHELLGDLGIVIVQPDNAVFKKSFVPQFEKELLTESSFAAVTPVAAQLAKHYKVQAHARTINLFYAKGHSRHRIEKVDSVWQVVDVNITFTQEELLQELNANPQHFSTNVITRGLYQEHLLPNIAFVGGGGELAYWMELKGVFKAYDSVMPLLVLRQSFQIIESNELAELKKLNFEVKDLFTDKNNLYRRLAENSLDPNALEQLKLTQAKILQDYQALAQTWQLPLSQSIEAHGKKLARIHSRLESKFYAQAKKKEALQIQRLDKILASSFLGQGLQERNDNFMDYVLEGGFAFFDNLYEFTLPFGDKFIILEG